MAEREQRLRQVRPDEPGGSGHDNGSFRHDRRARYRYRPPGWRCGGLSAAWSTHRVASQRIVSDLSPATPTAALQIIADGGPQTGFGHIGRCLAIAEAFGSDAFFSVEDQSAAAFIEARGARTQATGTERAPVVLIDRRAPTDAGEVGARHDAGALVVLLDDSGSGRDGADLVVDPPTAAHWAPTPAPRLAGFEHVLLRREVRDAAISRAASAAALPGSPRVLLAMGGSDPTGATPALADALAGAGIGVCAVLGPGYRGARPALARVLDHPERFVAALAGAELFVASYGHALLESAHLGVPAVAVVLLPEHLDDARSFCAHETATLLDLSAGVSPSALVEVVGALLASQAQRDALAARGRALIDGRGSDRVARAIRALADGERSPSE